MKKLTATMLASALLGLTAYAQGTINFINIVGSLNAPMHQSDGTTALSGTGFQAELLVGSTAANLASVATAGFLTGAGAGYFNGGTVTTTLAAGSTAFWDVRIWNTASGADYATASASGLGNSYADAAALLNSGNPFSIVLGGAGTPPSTPAPLTGLASMSLNPVPEPSSLALAGLGAAALMVLRRRK